MKKLFKKIADFFKKLFGKKTKEPVVVVPSEPKEEPKVEEPKVEEPKVEEPLVNTPKEIDIYYRVANYMSDGDPHDFAGMMTCTLDQINWTFQVAFGAAYCHYGEYTDECINTYNLHCQNTIKSCYSVSGKLRVETHDGSGSHCYVTVFFRNENNRDLYKTGEILADTLGKEINFINHTNLLMMKDVDNILVHFEFR